MRFEVEVLIERPVEDVYAFYTDVATWPLWNKLIREPSASETPWRLGTQIQAIVFGRAYTSKIIAVETNRKVTSKTTSGPFPTYLELTATFEKVNGRTRLKGLGQGEPRGLFKLIDPILAKGAQRQFQAQFNRIKHNLENRPPN